MADEKVTTEKNSFRDTLNLPRTDFPIRARCTLDDPEMIKRWQAEDLFVASFKKNEGNEKYILHDGPPYANGHIHLGHAYNKILKDILTKAQRMSGKHVPVTPGWDCHGLPIEIQVAKEFPGLSAQALKKECRVHAQKWIDIQREEFKSLGILMNWDKPYLTMHPRYEASILRAFGVFIKEGYIEKKKKTVPWCASCQTVLATAEIEYKERKDPSLYVRFPLTPSSLVKIVPELKDKTVSFLVWTTTPWTLPLNRAIVVKPETEYELFEVKGHYIITAKALAERICLMVEGAKDTIKELSSTALVGLHVEHPFIPALTVPVIADHSVSLQDGTAVVHCAPGCGPEDYDMGLKNKLEIFSPLSSAGTYTKGIEPIDLENISVADGQIWVMRELTSKGTLFFKTSLRHNYPHCWRCHNGLIFRATNQWFCNLSHGGLKERALKAIESINFLPEKSINYLKATISGRLEWCLSRQRNWGVPIPALLCKKCGYATIDETLVEKVAQGIEQHGIEYWDDVDITKLLSLDFTCPDCLTSDFVKERDILDVWFDSGVSHYAMLYKNPTLAFPADMYLEGIDQHRGWFQSSLLTSMVLEKQACTKAFITHGFTVDEKGHKMSKSLGNVVRPDEIIAKIGVDGLRLWVSTASYEGDAAVSDALINNVAEVYRKIRNTARFLLSNVYDFNKDDDELSWQEITFIDKYALHELYLLNKKVQKHYYDADFTAVFHTLADYCAKYLSSFYLDVIKDRLYVEKADGTKRRSAQTVCWYILDTLTRLMAPIMSITAEQISDYYQLPKTESIHLQMFADLPASWYLSGQGKKEVNESVDWYPVKGHAQEAFDALNEQSLVIEYEEQWQLVESLRSQILKALEMQREKGMIKHSLDAQINLFFDLPTKDMILLNDFFKQITTSGQSIEQFFKELCIVSHVTIMHNKKDLAESEISGFWISVAPAPGLKCVRCWQWDTFHSSQNLCQRCTQVLS